MNPYLLSYQNSLCCPLCEDESWHLRKWQKNKRTYKAWNWVILPQLYGWQRYIKTSDNLLLKIQWNMEASSVCLNSSPREQCNGTRWLLYLRFFTVATLEQNIYLFGGKQKENHSPRSKSHKMINVVDLHCCFFDSIQKILCQKTFNSFILTKLAHFCQGSLGTSINGCYNLSVLDPWEIIRERDQHNFKRFNSLMYAVCTSMIINLEKRRQ